MDRLSATRRAPFGDNPEVGARGRRTRQRILDAAFEVFDEQGVGRTSIEAITERAGCSRPTFYQYFGSKEELFRILAGRFGEDLARLTNELGPVDASDAGRDELLAWIAQLVEVYDRHRPVARGFDTVLRSDDDLQSGASSLVDRYRDALTAVLDEPLPSSDADVDTLASLVMVTVYGACAFRELAPRPLSRGRFIAAIADTVHRALFGRVDGVNLGGRPTVVAAARPAPYAPADPEPTGEDTRDRLRAAAVVVFGQRGYELTSIDDIVAAADLSHGAFYRYFDDKADAFADVATVAAAEMAERLDELPDPAGGVATWATDWYDTYEHHGRLFSVWPEATEAGVTIGADVARSVNATLRAALAGRTFGDVDADAIALLALLERGPNSAFGYSALTSEAAAAATAVFLQRAFFD